MSASSSSPPPDQSAAPQSPGSVVAALALDFSGQTYNSKPPGGTSTGRRSQSVPPPLSHTSATSGSPQPSTSTKDVVATSTITDHDIPDESIGPKLLSAVVWKRRTGISGKLKSESNAWERRRIELRGSYLTYHTCRVQKRRGSSTSKRSSSNISDSSYWLYNNAKGAADNVRYAANYAVNGVAAAAAMVNPYASNTSTSSGGDNSVAEQVDPNARGCLDLVKERATVAVARSGSGFPTPYTISVHAGYLAPRYSDIHWRFCFDSREEQVVWLSVLADVIVGFDAPQSKDLVTNGSIDEGEEGEEEDASKGIKEEVNQASPVSTENLSRRQHSRQTIMMRLILLLILVNALFCLSRFYPLSPNHWWCIVALLNAGILVCFGATNTSDMALRDPQASCAHLSSIAEGEASLDDTARSSTGKTSSVTAPITSSIPINPSHRPIAGRTTIRVKEPSDAAFNDDGHEFAKFRALPGSMFQVRSHGYISSKKKISSPSELYRLVSVDIFESQARIPDIAGKVKLPKITSSENSSVGLWNSPDTFVVSFTLPTEAPSIYKPKTDGQGYTVCNFLILLQISLMEILNPQQIHHPLRSLPPPSPHQVTMYYAIKESTRKILKRLTSTSATDSEDVDDDIDIGGNEDKEVINALKLFEEWCTRSPTDKAFQARFKVIILGQNRKEIGVSRSVCFLCFQASTPYIDSKFSHSYAHYPH